MPERECYCAVLKKLRLLQPIRFSSWESAKRGKFSARAQFDFNNQSPINQQFYSYKAVKPIFTEEPGRIVVITVNVYYFN